MTFRDRQTIDFWVGNLLLLLLFLPVRGLGLLLRRDHSMERRGGCVVIKLVGAGSLFLATPSLQAIRGRFPHGKFFLIGSRSVADFADEFGWFDECWKIDDSGILRLFVSSLLAILKAAWHCDHLIDLEVHSRLTTVLSSLTMVRNRIGFVDKVVFWRRGFYTHTSFFSPQGPVYTFYDTLAGWFGIASVPVTEVHAAFGTRVSAAGLPDWLALPRRYVAIGPGCSEFGHERQLRPEEWRSLLARLNLDGLTIVLLGGAGDRPLCAAIALLFATSLDLSGRLGIAQSAAVLAGGERFVGIDSLLLHLARALGVPTDSVWGPTDPRTRLRPGLTDDRVHFAGMPCSPCIHVHEAAPCQGKRACIPAALTAPNWMLTTAPSPAVGWATGPREQGTRAVIVQAA